ncbi:hypothetical protein Zmor_014077 [Zophobas morio]|uniref:Uncharacterized protein n=1 Tax=Zophobas morio TaxID=2755281 RepID=A0AA38IFC3_9CUCU|nr:hypothetical protein Zmor_014077 [Zophobas morio]
MLHQNDPSLIHKDRQTLQLDTTHPEKVLPSACQSTYPISATFQATIEQIPITIVSLLSRTHIHTLSSAACRRQGSPLFSKSRELFMLTVETLPKFRHNTYGTYRWK